MDNGDVSSVYNLIVYMILIYIDQKKREELKWIQVAHLLSLVTTPTPDHLKQLLIMIS